MLFIFLGTVNENLHNLNLALKEHLKYQDIQNVENLESKLRSELEQKIRSELEAEYKEKTEKGANLSPSLAKVRGSNEKEEVLPENPIDIFN